MELDYFMGQNTSLMSLQKEVAKWNEENFPNEKGYRKLLGVLEELGELAHAHLKLEQGIRLEEHLQAKRIDAIGDIVIYLLAYCSKENLWLTDCIRTTWSKVKLRKWRNVTEVDEELLMAKPELLMKMTRKCYLLYKEQGKIWEFYGQFLGVDMEEKQAAEEDGK